MRRDAARRGMELAREIRIVAAPAGLWEEIEAGLEKGRRERTAPPPRPGRRLVPGLAIAAGLLLVLLAAGLYGILRRPVTGWVASPLDGAPQIASGRLTTPSELRVGEWLTTDGTSRARIALPGLGRVEVEPGSRVRLARSRLTEQRLDLERGALDAVILAPPKIFVVSTPSASAVDMGCAYRLAVDAAGRGSLRVTAGWVALEKDGREAVVPAGALCAIRPGRGPGIPFYENSPSSFREALAAIEENAAPTEARRAALDTVLAAASARETLTLWHLLRAVGPADRGAVFERLGALSPPPAGVNRAGIERLDERMLRLWKNDMLRVWLSGQPRDDFMKRWTSLWGYLKEGLDR